MKFINKGEPIKVRKGPTNNCYWITLNKNETIELSYKVGIRYGLEELKITTGQIGDLTVETKQMEVPEKEKESGPDYTPDDLFFKELKKIKGIGSKTAKDIVDWGTKEKLLEQIEKGRDLPFRDDVEEKLKRKYEK